MILQFWSSLILGRIYTEVVGTKFFRKRWVMFVVYKILYQIPDFGLRWDSYKADQIKLHLIFFCAPHLPFIHLYWLLLMCWWNWEKNYTLMQADDKNEVPRCIPNPCCWLKCLIAFYIHFCHLNNYNLGWYRSCKCIYLGKKMIHVNYLGNSLVLPLSHC